MKRLYSLAHKKSPVLISLLIILALIFLLPRLRDFHSSLHALARAQVKWLVIAVAACGLSYCLAALTYYFLAQRKIMYGRTLLVQIASMFTNRLLPAGAGAIGINYAFLRKSKHPVSAAASVVTANNTLGLVGHCLILLGVFTLTRQKVLPGRFLAHPSLWLLLAAAAAIILLTSLCLISKRLRNFVWQTSRSLASYRRHPGKIAAGLLSSMLVTSCYALCLYASAHAVGVTCSLPATMVVLSLAVFGMTVTPTPGGSGGAEASLLAGFALYGAPASTALAAALLYRLCTYWAPFIIGIFGFSYAQRRHYF